jgi:hypothetical protein
MSNPFQKKARQRKIAYFVAILVLFSAALLHRHRVIEPMANGLQLRETTRGEVELTSSAVRLLMTGSRGLATTILWSAAIEKQKKHEWNEVELLVGSITKLQPNFITPWLFQSWNLAFNVSVECDQPRDKYYYVTRGLDLLAEGERRNQGNEIFPGHPEIRQTLGIFYLRKIGLSDEKTTMRCLLDLSCIDPLLRNPAWFKTVDPKDRREGYNTAELIRFCQTNPRLVRRLREGLNYTSEKDLVTFLERNQGVPTRFEVPDWTRLPAKAPEQRQSKLKPPTEQFPVLPPAKGVINTDPTKYELTNESIDVFLMARSWIEFSMQPLPPPDPDEKNQKARLKDNKRYRWPKSMATILFRGYPARCQAYIAEEGLEQEGWFDEDGWVIKGWFDREPGAEAGEFRVGTERKYHAQPAWDKAANLYYEYGRANDLLFTPQIVAELNREAEPYRKKYNKEPGFVGILRSDDKEELHNSWLAHHRLIWNEQNRGMSNYDNHYYSALAERTRDCVVGRKLFHQADITFKKIETAPEQALEAYEQAWPFWINVFLQNPKFASQPMVQEDVYEFLLKSVRLTQRERAGVFRPVVTAAAQMAIWPHPPLDALLTPSEKVRIIPIRNVRGVLDWIQAPKLPEQDLEQTRLFLAVWPTAPAGYPALVQSPPVWNLMLTQTKLRAEPLPEGWTHFIDETNVQAIRDRLGVNK